MVTLLKDMLVSRAMNSVAAGTTEQKSTVLDMQGYDSVAFFLLIGAVTGGGAVITPTIKSNTASSTSSPAPVAETGATCTHTDSGSDSNTMMIVDLIRPSNRYVFLDVTRTTENVVIDGVIAVRYNSKGMPVTVDASVIASALAGPNA